MMDYKTIKAMAKERRVKINDLLALAPKNDPFYVGRPADIEAAKWFADTWIRLGLPQRGVHLRRVHYRLITQEELIKIPRVLSWKNKETGEKYTTDTYQNVERCWDWLGEAGKNARYLGLVEYESFVDHKHPDAIINARWIHPGDWDYLDPMPNYEVMDGEEWTRTLPSLPRLWNLQEGLPGLPDFHITGYVTSNLILQPYHVEVWIEKTTMNDVLIPLCREYHVNLITAEGELSITAVKNFMERAKKSERPSRILYISDYDPAGLGMPISVARKVEFFQQESGGALDIRLQPIVLTASQVEEYSLPRVPVKDTDLRKANWEAGHGEGQTELDALESLYPGRLKEIVEAAILEYYDPNLVSEARDVENELEQALDDERDEVYETYQGDIDGIEADYETVRKEFNELREEFDELVKPFQEKIDAYKERIHDIAVRWNDLQQAITDDLRNVDLDLDDYPLPEPDLPEENDGVLYVSERDYLEQLEYYQAYRNGEET